ncbi:MAG: DNA repair protein RecO, partial [Euzebyales bacterium]|nr:DNA repair protein RecO [Euzebyales bacterium]
GETDRIVSLLTPGRGKVRAVAKGVRRPGSKFGGRLEPFSHVDLQLYSGRSLDVITQAELITPFAAVRADFALSACGSAMAEAADRVAQEDERSTRLLVLLLDGLRALSRHPTHPSVVLDAYLFRLASVAGYHPYLEACASCGTPGPHLVFHLAAGGVLCPVCAPAGTRPLDPGVVELLGVLRDADWNGLDIVAADPRLCRAAGALVNSFLTYHLGRPLTAWGLVPR